MTSGLDEPIARGRSRSPLVLLQMTARARQLDIWKRTGVDPVTGRKRDLLSPRYCEGCVELVLPNTTKIVGCFPRQPCTQIQTPLWDELFAIEVASGVCVAL